MRHVDTLGPYQLTRELSRGAMGAIYEAVHRQTGARHAVKVLLEDGLSGVGPKTLERFRRESEALGQLNHPHVVRVHAADLNARPPYLVLDLLTGGDLAERLRRGPLPPEEASAITLKLASGLSAAHALGILHRDLKPENVMFDERGQPRVVDFGLTRALQDADRLTGTGEVLGTPCFMAPEQAEGQQGDERTDVYGLGAVAYAMLTGSPPILPNGGLLKILAAVVNDPVPPPSAVDSSIPKAVSDVCMRALAKRPEERYSNMDALAAALEQALETANAPSGRPSWALAAIGSLAVVALSLAGVLALGPQDGSPSPQPVEPVPEPVVKDPREAALEALGRGDAAAALLALDDAEAAGADARGLQNLRGLAWLLSGELDQAEAALTDKRARLACAHERERLAILERLYAQHSLDLGEKRDRLYAELPGFVDSCRVLRKIDLVGPELMRRSQHAVSECMVLFGQTHFRSNEARSRRLFAAAEDLGPGPGQASLVVVRACIEHEAALVGKETPVDLALALREEGLRKRWRKVGLLALHCINQVQVPRSLDELPALGQGRRVSMIEFDVGEGAFRRAVDTWNTVLKRSLDDRDLAQAARAYRTALAFGQRRLSCAERSGVGATGARIGLAYLYLFGSQGEQALNLLAPNLREEMEPEVLFLRFEALLLTSKDAEELRLVQHRVDGLLRQRPLNHYLRCLRAALRFRRSEEEGAHLDLEAVRTATAAEEFKPVLPAPVWRTREETLREHRGEEGLRARLRRALQLHPE